MRGAFRQLTVYLLVALFAATSLRAATVCEPVNRAIAGVDGRGEFDHVSPSQVTFGARLGEGASAEVFAGTLKNQDGTTRTVVIKKFRAQIPGVQFGLEYEAYRALGRAVYVLQIGQQAHLVFDSPGAKRPTLQEVALRPSTRVPALADNSAQRPRFLAQLTDAVVDAALYAERRGVRNGDIKPDNFLIDLNGEKPSAEVIDYGLSLTKGKENIFDGTRLGTPLYFGLEAYRMADFTDRRAADSVAVTIKHLHLGEPEIHVDGQPVQGSTPAGQSAGTVSKVRPSTPAEELGGTVVQVVRPPPPEQPLGGTVVALPNVLPAAGRDPVAAVPEREGSDYVLRPHSPTVKIRTLGRVIDDQPSRIPPQLALVLDSHSAKSVEGLKKLVTLSRQPEAEFLTRYAEHWEQAWREADPIQRELLAYGLISSSKFSGPVFAQMKDKARKAELLTMANRWKSWLANETGHVLPDYINLLGRHKGMGKQLNDFLTHPSVVEFKP